MKSEKITVNSQNVGASHVSVQINKYNANVVGAGLVPAQNNRAITLIALIITIIILLILAGVTINVVLGENGIFNIAKEAVNKYENAQNEELDSINEIEKQIANLNKGLPENTKDTEAGTKVKIPQNWYSTTLVYVSTEDGSVVKKETKIASVEAIATGLGETVPVPNGFYYVGGTLSEGVVISDDVRDRNKYAGIKDVPAGAIYNSDGTVKTYTDEEYNNLTEDEKKTILLGNQFVWIPVTEEEYKKVDWKNGNTNLSSATYETTTRTGELAQIQKYGGFYIGRYEAGTSNITLSTGINFAGQNTATSWLNDNFSIREGLGHTASGNITTKAGEIPYYHADYETALKLSNNMYKTEYVQSGLVTGTMWDVMMKFIADGNDTIVISSDWGNYRDGKVTYTEGVGRYGAINSSDGAMTTAFTKSDGSYHYGIMTTAISEDTKKKNLYDVAGNLLEWTEEAAYQDDKLESYMRRSGSFGDRYSAGACYRFHYTMTGTATNSGFRPILYIK